LKKLKLNRVDQALIQKPVQLKVRPLSKDIKVLKLRTFGYSVSPSEMQGRMYDLTANTTFNPLPV
jgi:hypothetical protein